MLKNLKFRNKLFIMIAAVTLISVGISAYIGDSIGRETLESESFKKLTAVREMKAAQIEDYFKTIRDQILTLSENRMIIEAMAEFKAGFGNIRTELRPGSSAARAADKVLQSYYQEEFLTRLNPNLDSPATVADFWSQNKTTRMLQSLYISQNPYDVGKKHLLDNAGDGSSYSKAHQIYHPIIRNYLERFAYYDIFLIDHETGHIVYSVFKEVDFATSLLTGPFQNTNFANVFRKAGAADARGFVNLVDFSPYHPSYDAQASFIASPIYDGDRKIGVLVFQMPVDRINGIMTNKARWKEVGLGESGETYLVGEDFKLRTQSRFLAEDSLEYFKKIVNTNLSPLTIRKIRNYQSAIGLQIVKTAGTVAALNGENGTRQLVDYRGVKVLSAYKPLRIKDVNWVIMSEIDAEEAFSQVTALRQNMALGFGGLIILIAIITFLFARTITDPLKQLTARAETLAAGDLDIKMNLDREDEIGILSASFDKMRTSISELIKHQERAIDALATPLIPLHEKIVVMPLVGEMDSRRVIQFRSTLTEGLHNSAAQVAILDFTGVSSLPENVAVALMRAVQSAILLGARVILTGLQPDVARNLADLDLNYQNLRTEPTLQSGIEYALGYIKNLNENQ